MTKKTIYSVVAGVLGTASLYVLYNSKAHMEDGKLTFDFHAEIDLGNALYQITGTSNIPRIANS